ncbi:MAG: NUDIX hydrolase [Bacteroidota bacterium]
MALEGFTIRVYGLLENSEGQVLVLSEKIRGGIYDKFPGGGIELGEGSREALKRELMEELGIEAEIGDHLYTTDYFIESVFRPGLQVMALYYKVSTTDEIRALDPDIAGLKWMNLSDDVNLLSLESDRRAWMELVKMKRAALIRKRLKQ